MDNAEKSNLNELSASRAQRIKSNAEQIRTQEMAEFENEVQKARSAFTQAKYEFELAQRYLSQREEALQQWKNAPALDILEKGKVIRDERNRREKYTLEQKENNEYRIRQQQEEKTEALRKLNGSRRAVIGIVASTLLVVVLLAFTKPFLIGYSVAFGALNVICAHLFSEFG